jgi:hypothetical protein
MATGFTYAWYDDIQGQNYAGKLYNFVLFDKVCKIELRYMTGKVSLFLLASCLFTFKKRYGWSSVTMKSSSSSYRELEFPDSVVNGTGALLLLDPKPEIRRSFKITMI